MFVNWPMVNSFYFTIGKLKNELACACMNHCTLGEKQQPVKKNTHHLFQDISLYLIFTMPFYFSVFSFPIVNIIDV